MSGERMQNKLDSELNCEVSRKGYSLTLHAIYNLYYRCSSTLRFNERGKDGFIYSKNKEDIHMQDM